MLECSTVMAEQGCSAFLFPLDTLVSQDIKNIDFLPTLMFSPLLKTLNFQAFVSVKRWEKRHFL